MELSLILFSKTCHGSKVDAQFHSNVDAVHREPFGKTQTNLMSVPLIQEIYPSANDPGVMLRGQMGGPQNTFEIFKWTLSQKRLRSAGVDHHSRVHSDLIAIYCGLYRGGPIKLGCFSNIKFLSLSYCVDFLTSSLCKIKCKNK